MPKTDRTAATITWVHRSEAGATRDAFAAQLDAFAAQLGVGERQAASVARRNGLRVDTNQAGYQLVRTSAQAARYPF